MDDPKTWNPGDVVVHHSGSAHVLRVRKDDDSGWWLVDHGGLQDGIASTDDWVHLDAEALKRLFVTARA